MKFKFKLSLPKSLRKFRLKKKERVIINFGGKIYIGFTILVGIAAVNTGNNILYILLSFLLSLMAISGFVSKYNLKGLKISLISPNEVWCCKPSSFKILIRNRKIFPSFLLEILETEIKLKKVFPIVEKHAEGNIKLVFPRRGVYQINHLQVKSYFPFALFERILYIPLNEKIIVFPKPIEVKFSLPLSASLKEKGAGFIRLRAPEGVSVEGVKEYGGEGMRLIHWKAFAKWGELYAKEVADEARVREVIVDMDKIPASDIEERISKATYLVLHFKRLGYAVGLKYGDREIPPSAGEEHFKELLKFLALL